MHLKVMTPEKEALSAEAERIVLPGASGLMEILPGHARLVSLLKEGIVESFGASGYQKISVSSGVVEVADDIVTVLAKVPS